MGNFIAHQRLWIEKDANYEWEIGIKITILSLIDNVGFHRNFFFG